MPRISKKATFRELSSIPLSAWQQMPTLEQGWTDNLKFESSRFRVWTSRMHLEDYAGDREMYSRERLTIEQCVNGRWVPLDEQGRPTR